ncbi:MAG: hypothetical protein SPJ01_02175, partial [Butyricicoccus sp.]|nr:hypothetical protein [Butyricicoccus sp.]
NDIKNFYAKNILNLHALSVQRTLAQTYSIDIVPCLFGYGLHIRVAILPRIGYTGIRNSTHAALAASG